MWPFLAFFWLQSSLLETLNLEFDAMDRNSGIAAGLGLEMKMVVDCNNRCQNGHFGPSYSPGFGDFSKFP